MKKLTVVAVIVAVALTLVPAALAGGNGPGTGTGSGPKALKTTYSLNGTVKAVDTAASTLSVLVRSSNRHARAFRGDVVTISVTEATLLYRHLADCTRVPAALSDFAVGDRVTSVGGLDKTDPSTPVFTAMGTKPMAVHRTRALAQPASSRSGLDSIPSAMLHV